MKVGDLVKYIPTPLEKQGCGLISDERDETGLIVGVDGFWWSVLWIAAEEVRSYTEDSLEVINASR